MGRLMWLADVLRGAGLAVTEVDGWETRGAATMEPEGLIWHHTAGSAKGDIPSLNILINGRPDVPGPLCQLGLGRSGRFYVVASGRANHSGVGYWRDMTSSTEVIGIEAEHTGKASDPWPTVQLDAYIAGSAAIMAHLGAPIENLCGHKEWAQPPGRKVDPISLDMNEIRSRVADKMEDMTMALTADEERVVKDIAATLKAKGSNGTFAGGAVDVIRASLIARVENAEATVALLANRLAALETAPDPVSGLKRGDTVTLT